MSSPTLIVSYSLSIPSTISPPPSSTIPSPTSTLTYPVTTTSPNAHLQSLEEALGKARDDLNGVLTRLKEVVGKEGDEGKKKGRKVEEEGEEDGEEDDEEE